MRRIATLSFVSAVCYAALADEPQPKFAFIDLQPTANQVLVEALSDVYPDAHLGDLTQGEQKLGSATFRIGPGCIRLGSTLVASKPGKVEIPVKRKLAKLHILQGTQNGAGGDDSNVEDGTLIGQYTVHYSDGSSEGIFIIYGEDVRDWWNWDMSKETKRGKIAWTGSSPAAKSEGVDVRLYESSWANPKPDIEIASITFSSAMNTPCAPFCIALSAQE